MTDSAFENATPLPTLPGFKGLLFGPPGSGKTSSLRTLLPKYRDFSGKEQIGAGLHVLVQFTEPSMSLLGDTDPEFMHWSYQAPAQASWTAMIENAEKITDLSNDQLQKLPGMSKRDYNQIIKLYSSFANFTCQRCGRVFGPVDQLTTDCVTVLDGLSGLNLMAMDLAVGGKPIKTLPDWGVGIDVEEKLVNRLTLGTAGHFVLLAHVDRQVDQVLGGIKTTPAAIGQKLPNHIGRFFDDVIYSQSENGKFIWSTSMSGFDTKTRHLKIAKELEPSFVPLLKRWRELGGKP